MKSALFQKKKCRFIRQLWIVFVAMPLILSSLMASWQSSLLTPGITIVSTIKINKNHVEMLNTGLKALISIKRILNTIKSVNELSTQAFPSLANRPRVRFFQKLFGLPRMPLESSSGSVNLATSLAKRNPSVGLIKIGEKPPPGLFPETLPYSIGGGSAIPMGTPMSGTVSSTMQNSPVNTDAISSADLKTFLDSSIPPNSSSPLTNVALANVFDKLTSTSNFKSMSALPQINTDDLKTSGSAIFESAAAMKPFDDISGIEFASASAINPDPDSGSNSATLNRNLLNYEMGTSYLSSLTDTDGSVSESSDKLYRPLQYLHHSSLSSPNTYNIKLTSDTSRQPEIFEDEYEMFQRSK